MASPDMQRDLLLGHLAMELNFISAETLNAAKEVWSAQKSKSLGQILVDRQAISPHTLGVLENLVQLQLAQDASEEADKAVVPDDATMRGEIPILAPPEESGAPKESDNALRFHKLKPHAAGALGQVYVARDQELRRKVALKEIKDKYADNPDARSRFLLEAEITGRLEHPGVVPVYGLGSYANGRPFYAMRFIKGQSLADAIKELHAPSRSPGERVLELRKLLTRFIAVCNTMQYAHDRDIVHRDLKPSNIMLGAYGETLVVDWGLAKVVGKSVTSTDDDPGTMTEPMPASGSAETLPGRVVGTITYMSPEQAAGRSEDVGPASDVYSLGATLFSIITGRASVEDSNSPDQSRVDIRKMQRKVLEGRIHRPRELKPHIDRALEAICVKSMALDRAKRYGSARALADDLEKWLANEPVSAWAEPWTVRTRRWISRHRPLVAGAAAALLVGLVSSIAYSAYVIDAYNRLESATSGRKIAEAEKEKALEEMKEQQALADAAGKKAKEQQALADAASRDVKIQQALAVTASRRAAEQEQAAVAATKTAAEQQKLADRARIDAKKALADAARTLAVNTTMLAQTRWEEGQVLLANEMLETVEPQFRLAGWQFLRRQFEGSYATLYGHIAPVRMVAFSPNGRRLASLADSKNEKKGGKGGSFLLWDAFTGRPAQPIDGIVTFVFSPDGKYLATAGADGAIQLRDVAKAAVLKTSGKWHKGEITALAFSPDGKRLVSADDTGAITWCDADTLANPVPFKTEKGHSHKITSLSLSPDGKRLASASLDKSVLTWNTDTREIDRTFIGSTNGIAGAPFNPEGTLLATAATDDSLKVWSPEKPDEARTLKGRTGLRTTSVAFSPDGQRLASASFDGAIKIWDLRFGNELQTLQGHTRAVTSISFSPDGQRLVSASADWTVKLWDLATGQEIPPFTGPPATITCLSFCPDDKQRLAAGAWNGVVHIWNGLDGKAPLSIKAHPTEVLGVAFSADGTRVASGGQDGKIKIWDAASGTARPVNIKGHAAAVTSVAFSRDGQQLASASRDKTVIIWDATTGNEVWSHKQDAKDEGQEITSVAFSPDGQRLAWADRGGAIAVWNIKDNRQLFTKTEHSSGITSVAFAPVDDYLASAGQDGRVILWDGQGNLVLSLKGHAGGVMSVSFSSDGKRLASASRDGTVRLWDARTGQTIKTFVGHTDLVTSVAFSPGGKHLVSASLDKTVKLWDASTAKPGPIFKGAKPVESAVFSADGKLVFSRDESGKLVAWNVDTGDMVPGAVPDAGAMARPISPDEKKLALPVSTWFQLVDLEVSADEASYREGMSRLRPAWHRERALQYEKMKQVPWFAGAFHWGAVAQAHPADAEAKQHFADALQRLSRPEVDRIQRQWAAQKRD